MSFFCQECGHRTGEQFSYTRVFSCPHCNGPIQLINESGEVNAPVPAAELGPVVSAEKQSEIFSKAELKLFCSVINEKVNQVNGYAETVMRQSMQAFEQLAPQIGPVLNLYGLIVKVEKNQKIEMDKDQMVLVFDFLGERMNKNMWFAASHTQLIEMGNALQHETQMCAAMRTKMWSEIQKLTHDENQPAPVFNGVAA